MQSIGINQLPLIIKILEIKGSAEKMHIKGERVGCDSSGDTFSLYLEALDKITEMMNAYAEFLEHDMKEIQDSVYEIKEADTQMAKRWRYYGTGGDE